MASGACRSCPKGCLRRKESEVNEEHYARDTEDWVNEVEIEVMNLILDLWPDPREIPDTTTFFAFVEYLIFVRDLR